MIKALVFDVYGTLLDTRGCSLVIMKDVLLNCNCTLKAEFVYKEWRKDIEKIIKEMDSEKKFKTEKVFFKEALRKTLKRLKVKEDEHEKMKLYNELCWGNREVFPDTIPALRNLSKKYKLIIASNSDTTPLNADFERYGIKADMMITSEMLKFYKPHMQFYKKMLEKIKLKKDEIIYVGDTLKNDVFIPKKLGIKAVWINRKNKKITGKKPDFIIKSLKELIKLDFS
jgi:2-haloalkanoic acid dehalogenase type II